MLRKHLSGFERPVANLARNSSANENKFHELDEDCGIAVDLTAIITQNKKINYIGCDGRSAL